MTTTEFSAVLAFLSAGIGKRLSQESAAVYWELLGDLPVAVLRAAAKKVMLEHPWATFPSIAELRDAATEIMGGSELPPAEAWRMAREFASKVDSDIKGPYRVYRSGDGSYEEYPSQIEAFLGPIPPAVTRAIRAFGLHSICSNQDPEGVVRGHFLRMYEQIASREKRLTAMPEALKKEIEGTVATLNKTLSSIGQMPTTNKPVF